MVDGGRADASKPTGPHLISVVDTPIASFGCLFLFHQSLEALFTMHAEGATTLLK